jgi:DNA-binding beta-propeller fold protein YncE
MLILILILYDPTTLIYPPFAHTLGYHKATLSHLRLATGKPVDALGITGISAAKIKFLDDPSTHKDDDELSMFLCDFVSNSILYNIGLTDFGMYKSPVIGGDALWFPSDCEITPSGELFVVNRMKNRIVRFSFDGDKLNYLGSFGQFGILEGCFDDPRQISVTKYKVYVTDYGNNRIEIFDHQGNFLSLIGAFDHPTGIVAVSSDDPWLRYSESYIVVIDSCKSRLTKLTPDGKILSIVHKDELIYPRVQFEYIAVDYYGLIWVTDSYNNCLHLFDRNLKYIVKFGRKGTGDKEFLYPKGIAIWRRYGQVFVADSRSIQYFWVGVDAWIKGVRPGVFKPKEGVTVSYYLTQPALITAYIYDSSGSKIRTLKLGRIKELGQKYLLWDTISEEGQPVGEGKYRIELVLKPTYSSRGKFEKKISVDVQCRP